MAMVRSTSTNREQSSNRNRGEEEEEEANLLLQFASLSSLCLELIEEGNSSQTTADMKVVCCCSCFATQIWFFPPS